MNGSASPNATTRRSITIAHDVCEGAAITTAPTPHPYAMPGIATISAVDTEGPAYADGARSGTRLDRSRSIGIITSRYQAHDEMHSSSTAPRPVRLRTTNNPGVTRAAAAVDTTVTGNERTR